MLKLTDGHFLIQLLQSDACGQKNSRACNLHDVVANAGQRFWDVGRLTGRLGTFHRRRRCRHVMRYFRSDFSIVRARKRLKRSRVIFFMQFSVLQGAWA